MAMMSNWRIPSIRSERFEIFLVDDCPPSMITAAHPPGAPSIPATHDTADCLMWTPDNMRGFAGEQRTRPGRSSYRLASSNFLLNLIYDPPFNEIRRQSGLVTRGIGVIAAGWRRVGVGPRRGDPDCTDRSACCKCSSRVGIPASMPDWGVKAD